MTFGKIGKSVTCLECGVEFVHAKKLSEHIKKTHLMSSIDYAVKHVHSGTQPMCLHCGKETRFVSITEGFKKYCKADSKVAASESGKLGGRIKKSWNKGLTKVDDRRIEELAKKMTGSGNPFYGKKHTKKNSNSNCRSKTIIV